MTSGRGGALGAGVLAPTAALAGLAASASFAPFGAWPGAIVAVAVLAWCVRRSPAWPVSVVLGWVFGLAFMATSLVWQTSIMIASYTGLTLVTSFLYAAIAGLLHAVRGARAAPLWGAGVWVAAELVMSVFPFDGFAWMRLGYSQVESPLAGFYPFGGAASVTFLVALLGHLLAALETRPGRPRAALVAGVVGVAVMGVGALGARWMPEPQPEAGSVEVGWVQGGAPGGGVYGLGPARTITDNSRAETLRLLERIDAGELPRPAFVAWPENSTDMDPRQDALTRQAVEDAVRAAGVPILVGSIYEDRARQERQTVAVWWTDAGPQETYAKRNLVPFGEWIPFRGFFLPLIPQLAYVGYQSVPGTSPGSLAVDLPDGRAISVGVAICYEVIYPATLYEAAAAGAQVMIVQSSNAMYQGTNQIDQQFAITRVRAAEMRREILVVTTSGLSGLIGPRGEVLAEEPASVAASGVHGLPLRGQATPVMAIGAGVELALASLAVVGVLLAWLARRRAGTGGTMDPDPESGDEVRRAPWGSRTTDWVESWSSSRRSTRSRTST